MDVDNVTAGHQAQLPARVPTGLSIIIIIIILIIIILIIIIIIDLYSAVRL